MKRYRLEAERGRRIDRFESKVRISRMVRNSGPAQVSAARLAAGGVCGHHQATVDQLFWSLGPGRITGADRVSRGSQRGRAVFCLEGERHESGPEESMTAIIIAREELEPEALMSALGGL